MQRQHLPPASYRQRQRTQQRPSQLRRLNVGHQNSEDELKLCCAQCPQLHRGLQLAVQEGKDDLVPGRQVLDYPPHEAELLGGQTFQQKLLHPILAADRADWHVFVLHVVACFLAADEAPPELAEICTLGVDWDVHLARLGVDLPACELIPFFPEVPLDLVGNSREMRRDEARESRLPVSDQ